MSRTVEPQIFESQIPGGMLSNMESQLKEQGAGDRVEEVLAQVPRVRKIAGYPPLVTPSSQIVGTQAVLNVLMGEFKTLTGEFADLMLGYYGSTIGARDVRIIAAAREHAKKEPIDCRPADLLEPEWEDLCPQAFALDGCNESDEDILTYAMFPQVAPKFFAGRAEGPRNVSKSAQELSADETATPSASVSHVATPPVDYRVKIGQRSHRVTVERVPVQVGQTVKTNDVLMVLEAMKMETAIASQLDGKISKINAAVGDSVQVKQVLVEFV